MSNDTVYTGENQNLLKQLGLYNAVLEKTGEEEKKQIEWGQTRLAVFDNVRKDYMECVYTIKGAPKISKVKVFVATECGPPPAVINTGGHRQQNDGVLHFGYIFHEEKKDVKAIFFVIHSNAWGPLQKRFRTNTMLALMDGAINAVGEKVGGKLGLVIGAKVGTLIPIPIVGTVAGAIVGYFIGEATESIVDSMAGDYLRYIG
ncbi:MAG: hypothetical protein GY765_19405 [bacterium]|nr:hypothetical protein [bacterium]